MSGRRPRDPDSSLPPASPGPRPRSGAARLAARGLALLLAAGALAAPVAGCGNGSGSSTGGAAPEAKPAKMKFEVVLLDDKPNPFDPLPKDPPKGLATFDEVVVLGPEQIELRTYVRLVVQPGETWPQAMKRAKPWFDAIALPPGDRLVFSEIVEENEATKKREPVGARTFVATGTVVLGRDDVAQASLGAMPDQEGKPQPVTMIQLTPAAGERFAKFTRENVFRRLGVMIDDNLVMAARIEEEIQGGKISISIDPDLPYDVRRAELQRIADGLGGAPTSASAAPSGSAAPSR